jgi:hypothetical protein
MSAHLSVFDLKRFTQQRLGADELPSFEAHLAGCAGCSGRLQQAATRELQARGLDSWLVERPTASTPVVAALIALAASVLFVVLVGQGGPLKFPQGSSPVEQHGSPAVAAAPADGGMPQGTLAFFDGGKYR